jgi:hypothetical protein
VGREKKIAVFLFNTPSEETNSEVARSIEACEREVRQVFPCRATRTASAGLRSAAEPLPALPPLQPVCSYPLEP